MELPNLILVVLDTMRFDGMYPYDNTLGMPNTKLLCKNSTVYYNAVSPSPWTYPSHVSMFTGKYLKEHKVHETYENKASYLVEHGINEYGGELLQEKLRRAGYTTAAISANPAISQFTGFDRGFDSFTLRDAFYGVIDLEQEMNDFSRNLKEEMGLSRLSTRRELISSLIKNGKFGRLKALYAKYKKVNQKLKEDNYPLEKGGKYVSEKLVQTELEEPFFLFLNLMEMHDPYGTASFGNADLENDNNIMLEDLFGYKQISQRKMTKIRNEYRREAKLVDTYLGIIIQHLKGNHDYDNTTVAVTSDHGQSFKENGFFGHGIFLSDELIRVPLIVKYSGHVKQGNETTVNGYHNIKDLYNLFLNQSKGENSKLEPLPMTFSESYGVQHDLVNYFKSRMQSPEFEKRRNSIDVKRRAIYYGDYKLVVKEDDFSIEEFSYEGHAINKEDNKKKLLELKSELERFGNA